MTPDELDAMFAANFPCPDISRARVDVLQERVLRAAPAEQALALGSVKRLAALMSVASVAGLLAGVHLDVVAPLSRITALLVGSAFLPTAL